MGTITLSIPVPAVLTLKATVVPVSLSSGAVGIVPGGFPSGWLNLEQGKQCNSREELLRDALDRLRLNTALSELLEQYGIQKFEFMQRLSFEEWLPSELPHIHHAHMWVWGYVPTGFLTQPLYGYPYIDWVTSREALHAITDRCMNKIPPGVRADLDHLVRTECFGARTTARVS